MSLRAELTERLRLELLLQPANSGLLGEAIENMPRLLCQAFLLASTLFVPLAAIAADSSPLKQRLQQTPFKIAYETYVNENWEIFVMTADGSHPVNLTQTPTLHEHFPQVSPDGNKICFVCDQGEGRDAIRSSWGDGYRWP